MAVETANAETEIEQGSESVSAQPDESLATGAESTEVQSPETSKPASAGDSQGDESAEAQGETNDTPEGGQEEVAGEETKEQRKARTERRIEHFRTENKNLKQQLQELVLQQGQSRQQAAPPAAPTQPPPAGTPAPNSPEHWRQQIAAARQRGADETEISALSEKYWDARDAARDEALLNKMLTVQEREKQQHQMAAKVSEEIVELDSVYHFLADDPQKTGSILNLQDPVVQRAALLAQQAGVNANTLQASIPFLTKAVMAHLAAQVQQGQSQKREALKQVQKANQAGALEPGKRPAVNKSADPQAKRIAELRQRADEGDTRAGEELVTLQVERRLGRTT